MRCRGDGTSRAGGVATELRDASYLMRKLERGSNKVFAPAVACFLNIYVGFASLCVAVIFLCR